MAISVGRVPQHGPGAERFFRYGARLSALVAYGVAVAVAVALLAPVLPRGEPSPAPAGATAGTRAKLYETKPGDTLAVVAARRGISVTRLLALNPDVEPLGLEPGAQLRVR
jgi:hypothetical protein